MNPGKLTDVKDDKIEAAFVATDGEILLVRFTQQDVLAGRLVSPKSAFRMLISRPLKKRESKE
jgi:hypothetical protein